MRIVPIIFICASVVISVISIPLILEKIKPNYIYGFRTKKTLSNDEVWYKANKYAGTALLIAGLMTLISSVILLFLADKIGPGYTTGLSMILFVVPLAVSIIVSFNYLSSL